MAEESSKRIAPKAFEYIRDTVAPKVFLSLVRGIMKALFKLDEESWSKVLKEMSSACVEGFKKFLEPCTPGADIDSACEWLNRTVPNERLFYR